MFQRKGRTIVTAAVGALMLLLTVLGSASVGAAAPVNGCTLGNRACNVYPYYYGYAVPYVAGGPVYVNAYTQPALVAGATYFDPRYCGDGRVSVVPDKDGNLINVCTTTGVRIFPVYADAYPYVGPAYVVYR